MCWRHAHCPCKCCGHVEQVSPSPSRLLLLHSFQHWCSISTVGAMYLRARWLTDRQDTTVVPAQTKCWMTFLCSSNCSTLRKLQSKTCCASHFSRHFSYARYTCTTPSLPPPAFFVSCLISTFPPLCLFCLHTPNEKNTSIFFSNGLNREPISMICTTQKDMHMHPHTCTVLIAHYGSF